MSVDHYTYRVTWSQEDGEYLGLCLTSFAFLAGCNSRKGIVGNSQGSCRSGC